MSWCLTLLGSLATTAVCPLAGAKWCSARLAIGSTAQTAEIRTRDIRRTGQTIQWSRDRLHPRRVCPHASPHALYQSIPPRSQNHISPSSLRPEYLPHLFPFSFPPFPLIVPSPAILPPCLLINSHTSSDVAHPHA